VALTYSKDESCVLEHVVRVSVISHAPTRPKTKGSCMLT
jgi:hypothetical protein